MTSIFKKTTTCKIKYLVSNHLKKTVFVSVLFFAFLAHRSLNLLFLEIPDFNKLTVVDGVIKIHKGQGRASDSFSLFIGNKKILLSCELDECLPSNKTSDYQGKMAKVWCYKSNDTGLIGGESLLYQLEVNGIIVINYQDQVKHYKSMRNFSFASSLVFFIISLAYFVLLQFANDPNIQKKMRI